MTRSQPVWHVELGFGVVIGEVVQLGRLVYTRVRLDDGREIVVPPSERGKLLRCHERVER